MVVIIMDGQDQMMVLLVILILMHHHVLDVVDGDLGIDGSGTNTGDISCGHARTPLA
jgi:hypothetical protein